MESVSLMAQKMRRGSVEREQAPGDWRPPEFLAGSSGDELATTPYLTWLEAVLGLQCVATNMMSLCLTYLRVYANVLAWRNEAGRFM